MTFTVTYRDRTGAKREEAIEAASRAECVAECRKRGILPIAIREGGRAVAPRPPQSRTNGERINADSDGAGRRPYRVRLQFLAVLGTLVFLAILGVAVWRFGGGNPPPGSDDAPPPGSDAGYSKAVGVKPPVSVKAVPAGSVGRAEARPSRRTPDRAAAPRVAPGPYAPSAPRSDDEAEVSPEEAGKAASPKPHPRTAAETFLVMITPREPGERMPPAPIPPDMDEEEVDKALANAVKASGDDDERSIQAKINLLDQKEEFRRLRADGMTFVEYLRRLEEKFSGQADLLDEARRLNEELYNDRTISDEDYAENKRKIDETLRKEGLPPLADEEKEEQQ